ncbi:Metal resistance protein YCF1 [Aspergillus mulundensis]|uniref:Metal resistance protein YCF1 n=1 Tax=Aspergillus mulundensis TaxID=1810919 RepID=A0A3D8QZV1_9EURO|nr:Metal resistance protein YCF1 [Aspergillus mulundensis]RDW67218.1 Metal resistance protein YCF1 [Aspergillus mulundensis]
MCSIGVEDVFGPTVASTCRNGFDFTLLFEEAFFVIAPCSLLLLSLPFLLYRLRGQRFQGSSGLSLYIKLSSHLLSTAIKLALLILLVVPSLEIPKTRATVAAAAISIAASLAALALSYRQHRRSPRPSTLLTLFLGSCIPLDAVRARTIYAVQPRTYFIVFVVGLACDSAKFILECLEKTGSGDANPLPGEATGNVFNRNFYWWLNPLLLRGFREVLAVEKLAAIDDRVNSESDAERFARKWDAGMQATIRIPIFQSIADELRTVVREKSPPSLILLLLTHHRSAFLAAVLPRLALTGFTFAQPFLLTRIIAYISEPATALTTSYGTGLILATVLIYLGLAITRATSQHKTYRLITMTRGSLVPLMYSQTLRLDISFVRDSAALTLMSVDIERVASGLRNLHEVWASPVDVALALWLLTRQLGVAAVAPAGVFVICSVLGLGVASTMGARQRRWLEAIQERVQVTSDMLKSMKEIRLGGLQGPMASKLEGLRTVEISQSRPFKKALVAIVTLSFTTAASGPLLAFTMYTLLAIRNGTPVLNYDKAYTSLSLLALLQTPMALILDAIAGVVTAIGALQRIGEYLSRSTSDVPGLPDVRPGEDKQATSTESTSTVAVDAMDLEKPKIPETGTDTGAIIRLANFSAGWSPVDQKPFILKNLTLDIPPHSTTFILGPVASGKSTLLHAILRETPYTEGTLHVSPHITRIAFCAQTPWISNDTIRANILGTNLFVQAWYDRVVEAVALREDIRAFEHGDQTVVGGGGVSLSGGQRARLGIARAVYAKEKLLLLDDVFSGLDAKTEERVFHNLFGWNGLLKETGTTAVLATNAVHRIAYADSIILLSSEGRRIHKEETAAEEIMLERPTDASIGKSEVSKATVEGARPASLIETPQGSERRTGDMTVYKYYIQAVHPWNAVIFIVTCALFVIGLSLPQFVVRWWLQTSDEYTVSHRAQYLGIYAALAGLAVLSLAVSAWQLTERMLARASTHFHSTLLSTILRAPLSLFSTTDTGTIINRFAQDLQLADMELPLALFNTTVELLQCIAQLIIIAVASKYIGIALPALLLVFWLVQKFYLRTARQLRLLDIEAKAPLFSRFLEILSGLVTIRAFGWQADFEARNRAAFDASQKPFYLLFCVQRWLNLVLDLVVAGIAVMVVAVGVRVRDGVDAGFLGIALVNIVQFSISIKALLSNWTQLEISIGAVARIRSFARDTDSMAQEQGGDGELSPSWPERGHIEFRHVTASYEGSAQSVIRDLNLTIEHGQKIALCGRSGSGKSSLVSALFRMLDITQGSILIDGHDITSIPRETLATRLVCVTQTPYLLPGTIQTNIDPFNTSTPSALTQVLQQVHLWETVQALGGISATIRDDHLSLGQKQLLCLARAMVRTSCILILDEVTASVDGETDALVQGIIRTHFADRTVVTVAHRIETILDADLVAVLEEGVVVEVGSPGSLLEKEYSSFRGLHNASRGSLRV